MFYALFGGEYYEKSSAFFVIVAAILWGVMGIFVRHLERLGLGTMEIVAIRVAVTALILMVFLLCYDRKLLKIKLRDLWLFLTNGLISVILFNFCYYKAMSLTSLSVAAVLIYTSPIMVMIMSAFLFKERIHAQKVAALCCAFGGLIFVTGVLGDSASISVPGLGIGLLAAFGYSLYSILGTLMMKRGYHPLTVTAYTFFIASFVVVPMSDVPAIGVVLFSNGVDVVISFGLCYGQCYFAFFFLYRGTRQNGSQQSFDFSFAGTRGGHSCGRSCFA